MGSSSSSGERVRVEVLLELAAERAEGGAPSLEEYLKRYPGHAEVVARAFLEEADAAAGSPEETSDGARRVGTYRLLEELGRGGQGVVYLAEDERLGRRVALKVLYPGFAAGDTARLRFQREAELASRLAHPGICTVFETGRVEEVEFIAMRHVDGESLAEWIRRAQEHPGSGPVRLPSAAEPASSRDSILAVAEFVERAARALHHAHELGIVHRDVKPGNILVEPDGNPVLVDFGLARDQSRVGLTLTASEEQFGTPEYMSPEQVSSAAHLDARTDVYSLGVVLYKALLLETPFAGATVQAVVSRIQTGAPVSLRKRLPRAPKDLEVVLATATEHDLARRYQSALEFAEDLRRVREREPIRARPAGLGLRLLRWSQRNPVLASTGALLVVAVAVVFLLTRYFQDAADVLADQRDEAIGGMTRLTDRRRAELLLERSEEGLWPVHPDTAPACTEWLAESEELLAKRDEHEATLAQLRLRRDASGTYAVEEERVLDLMLEDLLARLDALDGRRPAIADRARRCATIERRSLEEHAADWERCIDAVASTPLYRGPDGPDRSGGPLRLSPQMGLVPLGPNAAGLWEFWHVESGERPHAGASGAEVGEDSGIVFVLLPATAFHLGCDSPDVPRPDPQCQANETPGVLAHLDAFFLSKFETTQRQWVLLDEGRNPSVYLPGDHMVADEYVSWAHPAQLVTWSDALRVARRIGATLPTEAQWEYACRAGTSTPYSWGEAAADCGAYGNFHGEEANDYIGGAKVFGQRDDHIRLAPVGAYLPNDFGLHDMHGNLWEWCRDTYADDSTVPVRAGDGLREPLDTPLKVLRGGNFQLPVEYARSARRHGESATNFIIGARFARPLDE